MDFKVESPLREHVVENAAAVTTTQDPTPKTEPDPKRQRLETPDPEGVIILDADGDLRLCVGADHSWEPLTFLVCSKSLSRSSPVMKQLILDELAGLPSLQSGQSNRAIHLPNDPLGPMRLMLEIIHGDFQKVPQTMEIKDLEALVVLMERYDALSLARPWVRAWLAGVRDSKEYTILLFIAWTLGDIELFSTTTSRLAEISTIDQNGKLIIKTRNDSETYWNFAVQEIGPLLPASVIERMAIERTQWISATVGPYIRLYNELKRGNCECRFASRHALKTMSPRCRALAIGSLVHGFLDMDINITTPNPTSEYRDTFASLVDRIDKLEILTDHNCDTYNHDECARMQEVMKHKRIVNKPLTYVEPYYRKRIESQAKKTGLSS
ncbi:hypothetical protein LX32DRAFT_693645 [Colletotrichum zoysiae]|uniref:Nuclear pore protein n=1 Tax=Colletotrichum zoysiae TaxID=1216348 RepID=A0AAD9M598_9PEZI|nr:hypothetical protein LX32DRAFT_693645 [Colletotrichum zoysiae]